MAEEMKSTTTQSEAVDPATPCSVTFYDEHRPCVQTYKVIWRDIDDPRGFEAGHNIAPMLQKWICEAMEHIYNGGPRPTLEPYVMTLGPREITSPNATAHTQKGRERGPESTQD